MNFCAYNLESLSPASCLGPMVEDGKEYIATCPYSIKDIYKGIIENQKYGVCKYFRPFKSGSRNSN